MRYKLLKSWLQTKIDNFNTGLLATEKLKEVQITFNTAILPASSKEHSYIVKLGSIQYSDAVGEPGAKAMYVIIEFVFFFGNKPVENYQIFIDTYLTKLMDIIENNNIGAYSDDTISTTLRLCDLDNVHVANLDKVDSTGKYLKPTIEFQIAVVDLQ